MFISCCRIIGCRTRTQIRIRLTSSQVIHGNSCNANTFLDLGLGAKLKLADILVTDPPYCLLNRRRKSGELRDPKKVVKKIDNQPTVPKYDNVAEYRTFTRQWLRSCIENGLKSSAPLVIWTNALGKSTIINSCKELSYNLRGEYLWAKRTDTKGLADNSTKNEVMLRVYETALVFQHSSQSPTSSDDVEAQLLSDARLPWSVVTGYHDIVECSSTSSSSLNKIIHNSDSSTINSSPSTSASGVSTGRHRYFTPHNHPCHKPLSALIPLISTWTKPGDVVLDPFCGSGGIALAVLKVGQQRSVKGVEVIPEWAEFAMSEIRRVEGSIGK